jgi:hypothetical protein
MPLWRRAAAVDQELKAIIKALGKLVDSHAGDAGRRELNRQLERPGGIGVLRRGDPHSIAKF